jgi:hypothetical protein
MFAVMQPLRADQWRLVLKADPVDSALARRLHAAHQVAIDALRERPRSSLELDRLMAAEVGSEATAATRPAWRQPGARIVVRTAWRHFAAFVPLVHVPHEGEGYGRSLYALAEDWLGTSMPDIDIADARRQVAERYFASFGPASLDDLVAYVGRGKGGVAVWREAIAALGDRLVELRDEGRRTLYDLESGPRPDPDAPAPPRLLARWDSLLLSHAPRHRHRVIADADRPVVFSKNADVLPTFLLDGFVAGTWELTHRDGAAEIRLNPLRTVNRAERDGLVAEAERVLELIAPKAARRTVRIGR